MPLPLDLLIHNAKIVDVFRLRTFEGWVGIRGGKFIYVEEGKPPAGITAKQTRDLAGRFLAPGLIDSHMHIESSHVTPRAFARAVLPHGTTTILADPHEVANVAGEEGVRWMIRASQDLPLRIFYAIPSCVPATSPELEWTGAIFDAGSVSRLAQEPSVIALGEVMDYRDVLADESRLHAMVETAQASHLLVEGHIPTLRGTELSQYLSWRITSDHTLTTPEKIREQISKGIAVMIQAKSCTPDNMRAIADLPDRSRILLITDDIEPSLLINGHLSLIVQMAIKAGMPPLEALASASVRPARYLGLRDLGGIAPGMNADFMVMDELAAFPPRQVYVRGNRVAEDGKYLAADSPAPAAPPTGHSIPGPFSPNDFKFVTHLTQPSPYQGEGKGGVTANAVVVKSDVTSFTQLEKISVRVQDGFAKFSDNDSLALVAVIARNRSSQSVGVIKDLGLHHGAVATSFAHDSHNLLVVGRDAAEMSAAANFVHQMGGGIVIVRDGALIAKLELPVLGLLTDAPLDQLVADFNALEDALRSLGVKHQRPFLMLSLLSLSVSPNYKFTDKGVIDTEARRLLPTWE